MEQKKVTAHGNSRNRGSIGDQNLGLNYKNSCKKNIHDTYSIDKNEFPSLTEVSEKANQYERNYKTPLSYSDKLKIPFQESQPLRMHVSNASKSEWSNTQHPVIKKKFDSNAGTLSNDEPQSKSSTDDSAEQEWSLVCKKMHTSKNNTKTRIKNVPNKNMSKDLEKYAIASPDSTFNKKTSLSKKNENQFYNPKVQSHLASKSNGHKPSHVQEPVSNSIKPNSLMVKNRLPHNSNNMSNVATNSGVHRSEDVSSVIKIACRSHTTRMGEQLYSKGGNPTFKTENSKLISDVGTISRSPSSVQSSHNVAKLNSVYNSSKIAINKSGKSILDSNVSNLLPKMRNGHNPTNTCNGLQSNNEIDESDISSSVVKKKRKRKSKLKRLAELQMGKISVVTLEAHSRILSQSNATFVQPQRNILTDINDTEEYPELGAAPSFKSTKRTIPNMSSSDLKKEISEISDGELEAVNLNPAVVASCKVPSFADTLEDTTVKADEVMERTEVHVHGEKPPVHVKDPIKISLFDMLLTAKSKKKDPENKKVSLVENSPAKLNTKTSSKVISKKVTGQLVNPLDSSRPLVKRGKEREKPKSKKISKMRKLILLGRKLKKCDMLLADGKSDVENVTSSDENCLSPMKISDSGESKYLIESSNSSESPLFSHSTKKDTCETPPEKIGLEINRSRKALFSDKDCLQNDLLLQNESLPTYVIPVETENITHNISSLLVIKPELHREENILAEINFANEQVGIKPVLGDNVDRNSTNITPSCSNVSKQPENQKHKDNILDKNMIIMERILTDIRWLFKMIAQDVQLESDLDHSEYVIENRPNVEVCINSIQTSGIGTSDIIRGPAQDLSILSENDSIHCDILSTTNELIEGRSDNVSSLTIHQNNNLVSPECKQKLNTLFENNSTLDDNVLNESPKIKSQGTGNRDADALPLDLIYPSKQCDNNTPCGFVSEDKIMETVGKVTESSSELDSTDVTSDIISLLKQVCTDIPSSSFSDNQRTEAVKIVLHSRKFRRYCNHFTSKDIDKAVFDLLEDLARFQDRMHQKDPVKARIRKRLIYGIKEIKKNMKLKKLKCIIIASDIEDIKIEGGLNDILDEIMSLAKTYQIPYVFSHRRYNLGKVCRKSTPVSCVGIFNYEGSEKNYKMMLELQEQSKHDYNKISKVLYSTLTDNQITEIFETVKCSPENMYTLRAQIMQYLIPNVSMLKGNKNNSPESNEACFISVNSEALENCDKTVESTLGSLLPPTKSENPDSSMVREESAKSIDSDNDGASKESQREIYGVMVKYNLVQ